MPVLDAKLAASVISEESNCDSLAVSSRGAIGLMQVMPRVWKRRFDFSRINLFNPQENLNIGIKILADLVQQYGEHEALERYQGLGPGNPNYSNEVLATKHGNSAATSTKKDTLE